MAMKPCKLLIVDDDEILRNGLTRNIAWQEHGFEIVGLARNGLEGLEWVGKNRPQVVISDIRMPFMDGIQMVESLREIAPDIKVVLLTGYEDFSYAKKALGLKVVDYILKYAENDEILHAAVKAREEWQRENQVQRMACLNQMLLKQKFLQELITAGKSSEKPGTDSENLGLNLSGDQFTVGVIRIQTAKDHPAILNMDSLLNLCRVILAQQTGSFELAIVEQMLIVIFGHDSIEPTSPREIEDRFINLLQKLPNSFQDKILLGVGESHQGLAELSLSYQEALTALKFHGFHSQTGSISYYHRLNASENFTRLQRILAYVDQNYTDPDLSLVKVAGKINISPSYISMIFKKYHKVNFCDYLTGIRLEKAKELLEMTNLMTYEVAEQVGYTNPQYFSILFKKHTGHTPTEYKDLKNSPQTTTEPS